VEEEEVGGGGRRRGGGERLIKDLERQDNSLSCGSEEELNQRS